MKKALMVFGVVFLVLITVGAIFLGYSIWNGARLDNSSRAYVDDVVPKILSAMSKDEIMKYASPEFQLFVSGNQLELTFHKLKGLGELIKCEKPTGQSLMKVTNKGEEITADYKVTAKFKNGNADVYIKLGQSNEHWQILAIRFESPIFLK